MALDADVPIETTWRPGYPVDVRRILTPLRHGSADPTIRFLPSGIWRATRNDDGPVSVLIEPQVDAIRARAWGPGAERAIEMLPRLLGADDHPAALVTPPGPLRELVQRFPGLRFGRTDRVLESMIPAICEQKVTGQEATRAYRCIVLWFGEDAPGPAGLRLPPTAERLATVAYHQLHPAGLEQRRAVTILRAASRGAWLEAAGTLTPPEALARLRGITGVGPWTAAETARAAFGDPDAVSVGDFHLPNLVSWALAGEPRGDDARMLELLEQFRGQRARLVRLLELSGIRPPRYGPRMPVRSIASM
jgi:3-methyladenine DNA glycosylase/8-oxoguanine DNA glycosylase